MQDFSQLKKDYGKEQADVIVSITGNIISGQVMGETSKLLSERLLPLKLCRFAILPLSLLFFMGFIFHLFYLVFK